MLSQQGYQDVIFDDAQLFVCLQHCLDVERALLEFQSYRKLRDLSLEKRIIYDEVSIEPWLCRMEIVRKFQDVLFDWFTIVGEWIKRTRNSRKILKNMRAFVIHWNVYFFSIIDYFFLKKVSEDICIDVCVNLKMMAFIEKLFATTYFQENIFKPHDFMQRQIS